MKHWFTDEPAKMKVKPKQSPREREAPDAHGVA
jgi:hypothetical protein